MHRTFRYPLLPNRAEEATLEVYLWRCQQLYNAALEQRISAYKKQRKSITRFDQTADLAELRQHDPDFKVVPSSVLRSALKRLDLAYRAFFRRVKQGEKPGFPRFRNRDRYRSFSLMREPRIEGNRVHIPKLGAVKFKLYRPIKGVPLDATIRKDSTGRWWLCIQCDVGEAPTKIHPTTHVGINAKPRNLRQGLRLHLSPRKRVGLRSTPKEELVQDLLTDEVLDAFHEASQKFKTRDLVVTSTDEQICVYVRESLVAELQKNPTTPEPLIEKLCVPAIESLVYTKKGMGHAFWFIVDIEETTVCCAISTLNAVDGPVS